MRFLDRLRAWFTPKPKPRPVWPDEWIAMVPNDVMMQAIVRRTFETGEPQEAFRPDPAPREGESVEQARERYDRELDVFADLLGVDRMKAL